ncbi:hypothetical protein Kpol_1010p28 [Vanderwaltozyma polyspora DSM 70294]|uniref:Arrestin C-terminal-like domain-containing protein n=1 Tax=Vanderwaltozyma polyspora (strain ATCC 22028 / DSM 70294 / BCRC 21397 / CBS 2163 / NBRC 10782 / NRRL Y-8283 / UCD 57-17) TaxID=436907 RepID=A7TIH5_VANPO|nr:uncharacterized protein Kpol_1010p28 [Vanderwaltozyma polyspora DSM 70294]EDO17913.1 hypothetical protein Kpol_1010p28 [Vanderwaltozyma polyspora DSM 70294]
MTSLNSRNGSHSSLALTQSNHSYRNQRRSSTFKHAISSILGNSSATTTTTISSPTRNVSTSSTDHKPVHHSNNHRHKKHNTDIRRNSMYHSSNPLSLQEQRRHSTTSVIVKQPAVSHSAHNTSPRNSNLHTHDDDSILNSFNNYSMSNNPNSTRLSHSNKSTSAKSYLTNYLLEKGFVGQKLLFFNDDFKLSVATTGENVFLPTVSESTDEYLERLNGFRNENDDGHFPASLTRTNETDFSLDESVNTEYSTGSSTESNSNSNMTKNRATSFEITDKMTPHGIALVLSVDKPTTLKDFHVQLCSRYRVYWNEGVPPTKTFKEEIYNGGKINWLLTSKNYDLFVPSNVTSKDKISENINAERSLKLLRNYPPSKRKYIESAQTRSKLLGKVQNSKTRMLQPGDYVFILPVVFPNNIPESLYFPSARVGYRLCIASKYLGSSNASQEGSSQAPNQQVYVGQNRDSADSLQSSAQTSHTQKTFSNSLFKKVKGSLRMPNDHERPKTNDSRDIYVEYPINVVRMPPQISVSTANKSIYINRVWANALAYEISIGQKFISLNSKVPVKIKLTPMSKHLRVERVRVSIVEKITLVSKNHEYEFDQTDILARDPYNPYYQDFQTKRRKERTLALLEVRTKEKGGRALREEIVDNAFEGNLLSYDTIKDQSRPSKTVGITESISIESKLEFPKYDDLDKKSAKTLAPYGVDHYNTDSTIEEEQTIQPPTSRRGSVLGFFSSKSNSVQSPKKPEQPQVAPNPRLNVTTFRTNAENQVKSHTKLYEAKRGIYLDSLNCSNVSCKHKLEVMFRISKKDDNESIKARNYEVLIDIPIYVVSELCNSENMDLPTYEMASVEPRTKSESAMDFPPSFEEVFSVPGSPMDSPMGSPMGSPSLRASHHTDDSLIQNLSLGTDISSTSNRSRDVEWRDSGDYSARSTSNSAQNINNSNFSNLDGLLSTSPRNSSNPFSVDPNVPFCTMDQKEAHVALFKEGYSMTPNNTIGDTSRDDMEMHEVEGPGLQRLYTTSDPPTYDDVISQ